MSIPATEFETIRRNRVYEEVARQIERVVIEHMKPGDKLPPERQLAEKFGVSRSSIRDAIRRLEAMGLLEPRQGAGTVVREVSTEVVVTPITSWLLQKQKAVSELLDVRRIIEPPLAARAALHATAEEFAEMENILRRQGEKVRRGELTIEEDSQFHYSIAVAADNTVILKVLDMLMDLLRESRERSLQVEGRLQKSFAGHQRILAALKKRDPVAAQAAMQRHIEDIEAIVVTKVRPGGRNGSTIRG